MVNVVDYLVENSSILDVDTIEVRDGSIVAVWIIGQAVGIFEDSNDLHIVFLTVTEDVGQHW